MFNERANINLEEISDEVLLYETQLAGWRIMIDSAKEFYNQGRTYIQWLQDFSPRDAIDYNRYGWPSTRALIDSNFAKIWKHVGGSFTSYELLMITP